MNDLRSLALQRTWVRRVLRWTWLAPLLAVLGCAGTSQKRVATLKRQLDSLAQRERANQQRIEELNNRLYLLEDRLETNRVAQARRSDKPIHLPVVRLGPAGQRLDDEKSALPARQPEPPSLVASSEVEYSGAAQMRTAKRPLLRLHGDHQSRLRVVATPPGGELVPAASSEQLPVVPLPRAPAKPPTVSRKKGEAERLYQRALADYRAGRVAQAERAFAQLAKRFPTHDFADNALYWLGEARYDRRQFDSALGAFRRVVEEHPKGNKAPDALLKMGYCYMQLKQTDSARTVLAQLVEIFPGTRVAKLATDALGRLK
ncbi:MAG: tol-pal system protein YbgF [Deltaproteobacteria bacterium]|nr:tol-pal system protein YbgF [Deltaproteobacteria bacterium]